MKFQLDIADRVRTVEVQPQDGGFTVTVDGRAQWVDARRVGDDSWSLLVREDGGGFRSVEASVVSHSSNGTVDVQIDGYRIAVHSPNGRGRRGRETRTADKASAQRLSAPMPGKVIRVLVKPGDTVQARQVVVVVEAMKMENELRATRDGRIGAVYVSEGQSVEASAALLVVE